MKHNVFHPRPRQVWAVCRTRIACWTGLTSARRQRSRFPLYNDAQAHTSLSLAPSLGLIHRLFHLPASTAKKPSEIDQLAGEFPLHLLYTYL